MNTHIRIIVVMFGFMLCSVSNAEANAGQDTLISTTGYSDDFLVNDNSKYIQLAANFKKKKSGQSGKDGAKNVPSWAKGKKPFAGESGSAFAKRLLNEKYPKGGYPTGPGSEYNQIKKYGDRAFE